MTGGGERRDEEAVPAEYKPALFPGGESDWINRMVPSAESLSLAGSPTGTLTGTWLHRVSRDIFLLPVLASPLPDSAGLRWAVCGCAEKGALGGPCVCALLCCHCALSALSWAGGLTSRAGMGRESPPGRRLERGCCCALGAALGREENGSHGREAVSKRTEQGLCL